LNIKSAIKELKRRNVIKAAIAYLAIAWLILQVFSLLFPLLNAPTWILKILTLVLFIGFPCWIIFSCKYQITWEGIRKIDVEGVTFSKEVKVISALIFLVIFIPFSFLILRPAKNSKVRNVTSLKEITTDTLTNGANLTKNLAALDFYLKGEYHFKRQSLADINLAIDNYLKAIENDSHFAMAYSNLGSAYMRKNLSFDPNIKWEEEAYSAAGKALQLDPKLANPHIIQGQFFWSPSHNFAHEAAMNEFKKAIIKDSTNSQSYEQLSLVQLHVGLFKEALKNAKKSITLDPGNYRARRFIAEIYLFQGNYKQALKEFNKIPKSFAQQPTQAFKALTYFYIEDSEMAIQILKENLETFPNCPHSNSVYAIILSSRGENKEALKKIKIAFDNLDDFIHAHHIYYYLAISYNLMNDKQEAIKWLEKAIDTGFPNYPLFKSDPKLQNLNNQAGYLNLLSKLEKEWEYFKAI